ncbi:MAG: hypothetical protein ACFE0J_25465 [Elainellaceae cyanobacterium]
MSSSGRYQSNILNFLSQQRLRLNDQYQRRSRQVKLVAVWGTQILLYPLYALFQTSRLTSRQIGRAVRRVMPRLRQTNHLVQALVHPARLKPPPTVDTPTWKIMEGVQAFELPIRIQSEALGRVPTKATHRTLNRQSIQIRGIATQCSTGKLVLVTTDNRSLDLFTPRQCDRLRQKITSELASYHRDRLRAQSELSSTASDHADWRALPLPTEYPQQWSMLKRLNRLMAWMQTSQVAIAANVFHESRQVCETNSVRPDRALSQSQSQSQPNTTLSPPQLARWSLLNRARALGNSALLATQTPIGEWQWFDPDLPMVSDRVGYLDTESDDVQRSIIQAESRLDADFLSASTPVSIIEQSVHQRVDDLMDARRAERSALTHVATMDERSPTVSGIKPESDSDVSTPWVDAKVAFVGYAKHPLEQALEWLDSGMLWLERAISKVWSWMTRHI